MLRTAILAALTLVTHTAVDAQRYSLPDETPPAGGEAVAPAGDPRIVGCLVDLVHDIQLPATDTGVLVHLGVREGDEVRAESVIAKIDDREASQARSIAQYAKQAADARAEDQIEILYSEAAARVARVDWEELLQANDKVNRAVTESDIRRAKLEYDRAKFGIEKAQKDQLLAGLDAQTKLAELEATDLALDRRRIIAPFDGEILEVHRHQQEWVQAGDPIVRIAQLNTLQVDGWVYYSDFAPSQVDGREVTIEVNVGRGRVETATGRVVYVSPLAEGFEKPKYRVRAEITNRRDGSRWLISPGLDAVMTIHLGQRVSMNNGR